MPDNDLTLLAHRAGSIFTPGAPVNEKDLFAGRIEQLEKVMNAASQRGYHAVIFGERGVGKTSLANIIGSTLGGSGWLIPRVNCDALDTFTTLWRKALRDIAVSRSRPGVGFGSSNIISHQSVVDTLPAQISPDDVRRALDQLSAGVVLVVIFDEFDRVTDKAVTGLMADTIKTLSDYAVDATVVLIGVADSVDDLIEGHQSIERALVQIPMPRMSVEEIDQIVENGLTRLGMSIDPDAKDELMSLAQGLPYITHLLALNSVRASIRDASFSVGQQHVDAGIKASLEQWQQSVIKSYHDATNSSQPGNIYKPVLLACALAEADELGYFTASGVRTPLRIITDKQYDIPNYAQHLKNFSDADRGGMLQRVGGARISYRFTSPLLRPYIIMRGFAAGLITRKQMQKIAQEVRKARP